MSFRVNPHDRLKRENRRLQDELNTQVDRAAAANARAQNAEAALEALSEGVQELISRWGPEIGDTNQLAMSQELRDLLPREDEG